MYVCNVCIYIYPYLPTCNFHHTYIHTYAYVCAFPLFFLFCIHTYVYIYHKCTEIFKALLIYITFNILQVVLSSVEWTKHSDETQNRIILLILQSDVISDTRIYTANGQAMQALLKWRKKMHPFFFSFSLYSSNVVIA